MAGAAAAALRSSLVLLSQLISQKVLRSLEEDVRVAASEHFTERMYYTWSECLVVV